MTRIPWNEEQVAAETKMIAAELAELNGRGILTINSQPRVNGEPSTHPELGWGKPGGYIYQKVCVIQQNWTKRQNKFSVHLALLTPNKYVIQVRFFFTCIIYTSKKQVCLHLPVACYE